MVISDLHLPDGVAATERMISVNDDIEISCTHIFPENTKTKIRILFVPGWIADPHSWRHFFQHLAQVAEIYYLETREKSSSKVGADTRFTVEVLSNDVANFINQTFTDGKPYFALGVSLGATTLLETIPKLKQAPQKLFLITPTPSFELSSLVHIIRITPNFLVPPLFWLVNRFILAFRISTKDAEHRERFTKAMKKVDLKKLKQTAIDLHAYQLDFKLLDAMQVPTLVISASSDKLHRHEHVVAIQQAIAKSQLLDLKLFSICHSSKCAALILEHIERKKNLAGAMADEVIS